MQITHFGHSCVLLETGSARLLIDPGTFAAGFEDLRELDGVLITHQHPDHLDFDRVPQLLEDNPHARFITDPESAEIAESKGFGVTAVQPGDTLSFGTSTVDVVGGKHAVIHPDLPLVDNVGFLVDAGAFYHPGDSFHVPQQRVDVLGLPTAAPWLKLSEAVDFLREVAPRVAVPIHEAVLARPEMHYRMFEKLGPKRTEVAVLDRELPTSL